MLVVSQYSHVLHYLANMPTLPHEQETIQVLARYNSLMTNLSLTPNPAPMLRGEGSLNAVFYIN